MWYRQETEACSCYTDVTRKGRQPSKDAFYCFTLSANASLSPQETTLNCRWVFEAFASCRMANTPTKGWTTTLELCPFDCITWCLFFKACGQFPLSLFLRDANVGLRYWKATGASFQARPGRTTMGITSWLFAFVSVHRPCGGAVTSTEDKITRLSGSSAVWRRTLGVSSTHQAPHVHRLSVQVLKESNRDNDGERLHTSKLNISVPVLFAYRS